MGSPPAREWEQAMKEEISSLKENDAYELSTSSESKDSVGGGGGGGDGCTQPNKIRMA
jgi:hypothetical protein